MRQKLASLSVLAVVFATLLSGAAVAATPATTSQAGSANGAASDNGLKVSPVRTDATVAAGSSQQVQVSVTNVTSATSSYDVVVNDFTASGDESGQPQILLDANQFAPTHSLKRLVGSMPTITLAAGETKNIPVPINVPKNYKAGGYYGAVRFVPHNDSGAADKNVTLSASVGSLILVTVPGDIHEQLSVASLDARKAVKVNQVDSPRAVFFNNKSINGVIRFQNGGDVQEQPYGKLVLKNWRGKTLATYEINNSTPRGNVLPDSIRKFTVSLTKLGGFGKYTLEGNFGYGNSGQLITAKSSFYIIPLSAVIAVAAVVLLILFLIFGLPRLVRRYNRRVIAHSQSRR